MVAEYTGFETLIRQVAGLSAGTICTLTGLTLYKDVNNVHAAFIEYAKTSTRNKWQDAWNDFVAGI